MVICGMLTLSVFAIITYSFTIFLVPITTEFGWERGEVSAAFSLTTLIAGVIGILAGRLSDKYGPRPLVTIGGLAAGTGYFLMSQINSLWQVYLIWGLLMAIGWVCFTVPVMSTIPRWFSRRRGMAQGVTLTGTGLGGLIWSPLAQSFISSFGWQQAYVVLGLITILITIPLAQFMKHSPQRIGLESYGESETLGKKSQPPTMEGLSLKQTIKTTRFWIFGSISFSFLFCLHSIMVHITHHAIDVGMSAMVAASIPATFAAVSLIGRFSVGFFSDKVGPRVTVSSCLIGFTLALTWLLFAREVWMFYIFAVIFGIAYGGEVAVTTLVPAELFGLKYLGTIAATTFLFGTIGGSIGPFLTGTLFDITESYLLAFLICIMFAVLAITLSLILLRSKNFEEIRAEG